jgi:hypothetical protein
MNYYRTKVTLICCIGTIVFFLLGTAPTFSIDKPLYAVGIVYNDINQNQVLDIGEKGIPKVAISNGRDIVQTDKQGKYRIPIEENMILFVIKPTGWTTPFDSNHYPLFYYIYKPAGSPKTTYPGSAPTGPLPASIDFPLYKQQEPNRFKMIYFGDIQVTSQQQIDYFAHDVVEELVGTDAKFIVTLGDNVGDTLGLYPALKETSGLIGIPLYFAMGNHDSNQDAASEKFTQETFSSQFGPPYYSFDYSKVHFLVLEDIEWKEGEGQKVDSHYFCGLGEEQLQFIKTDLALVPKDYLIVLSMHIPINQIKEKKELFRLLEKRKYTFSISGHEHTMEQLFLGLKDGWLGTPDHHHFIGGAVCGSWWIGTQDEYGIPHSMMADGAPNGYTIITSTGNKYTFEYKSARKPLSFQMQIYAPDEITLDEVPSTVVQANIFAGSEKSNVEIKFGETGTWMPMEKASLPDPFYTKQYEVTTQKPGWIPRATKCPHMWKKSLTGVSGKGVYLIQVRETDMFGQVHTGSRAITIK